MSFTKKLYIWMLALLILALDIACAAVYLRSLNANMDSETRRATTEQYAAQLGLSSAENELEMGALFKGFADAYASTGARLTLTRSGDSARRVTEIIEDDDGRAIMVTGPLPERFGNLALVYQRDLEGVAQA